MEDDKVGRRSALRLTGVAAAAAVGGALVTPRPAGAAPATFNTINPYRSVDSRAFGPSARLSSGFEIDWDIFTDQFGFAVIPTSTVAITFNLTVTETAGGGFLAIFPANGQNPGVSTLNWSSPGTTIANGGTVAVGTSPFTGLPASVTVSCGGVNASTHYIIDVTGIFL